MFHLMSSLKQTRLHQKSKSAKKPSLNILKAHLNSVVEMYWGKESQMQIISYTEEKAREALQMLNSSFLFEGKY